MNPAYMLQMIFLLACACPRATIARAIDCGPQSTQASQTANSPPGAQSKQTQPPSSKPHRRKHKKAAASSNCSGNQASGTTANGSANVAGAKAPSSANCPPPKTVVKNGGTSEPAEQLTGGEGSAQAQQRSTTDQLLGSTEENLKKIDAHQLTSAQQEMVSQIRQYMQQSKEAVTAGDTERGRMLAQKAQLLSDELVKP